MRKPLAWPLGVVLALLAAGPVRGEYLDWSYDWSMTPSPVFSSGTGHVSFGPLHDHQAWFGPAAGVSVALLDVGGVSSAGPAHPDRYDFHYDLKLHLTDNRKHQSDDVVFHGNLAGTYSFNNSALFNTFTSPLRQPLSLFGGRFDAVLETFGTPQPSYEVPPMGGVGIAEIPFDVRLQVADHAPELPSLALGGVALMVLGASWFRKHFRSHRRRNSFR